MPRGRRVAAALAVPALVLVSACSQAVDVAPGERITRDHGLVKWGFPRLLTTFLDSPDFYAR